MGEPNAGHAAVADFLICRAAHAALSANFDDLIEHWAESKKVYMRGALSGQDAVAFTETAPLLKFHGCLRTREQTLWTQNQLHQPETKKRVESCTEWMKLNLPGKDLLVIGFWTDWGYLNDVLANAMKARSFNSVTVVDPLTDADLEAKAPVLWEALSNSGAPFQHVQGSGADALEELRVGFSKVWARKFFELGRPLFEKTGGVYSAAAVETRITIATNALYDFRRDVEGLPYCRAARKKEPAAEAAQAALMGLLLIDHGATTNGSWYVHGGRNIRVVHGGGQGLSTVQDRYKEPPAIPQADIVVCAGAVDLGVPARVIAPGFGASAVRPAPGVGSRWLTLEQARSELGV